MPPKPLGEVEPGGRGTGADLEALPRLQEGAPGSSWVFWTFRFISPRRTEKNDDG